MTAAPSFSSFPDFGSTKPVEKEESDRKSKIEDRDKDRDSHRHSRKDDRRQERHKDDRRERDKSDRKERESKRRKTEKSTKRDSGAKAKAKASLTEADIFLASLLGDSQQDVKKPGKQLANVSKYKNESFYSDTSADTRNPADPSRFITIPTFRRSGRGLVIGFDPRFKMVPFKLGMVQMVKQGKEKGETRYHSIGISDAIDESVYPRKEKVSSEEMEYIQLPKIKKALTDGTRLGRLPGEPENSDVSRNSLSAESEDEDDEEEEEINPEKEYIAKRTAIQNAIDADPTNIKNWLQMIEIHDKNPALLQLTRGKQLFEALQGNREAKLAILKKALRYEENKNSTELVLLNLRLLSEAGKKSERELRDEWESALIEAARHSRDSDHNLWDLWDEYLTFRTKGCTNITDIQNAYSSCLEVIRERIKKASPENLENLETIFLRFLARLVVILISSGYKEMGFCIVQALLELGFFSPPLSTFESKGAGAAYLKIDKEDVLLDVFRDYWDLGYPRVGEPNASGWSTYSFTQEPRAMVEPNEWDKAVLLVFESLDYWADNENTQNSTGGFRIPTLMRLDDDPYRVVLFDDIKSVLFVPQSSGARNGIIGLLGYVTGIPYPGLDLNDDLMWTSQTTMVTEFDDEKQFDPFDLPFIYPPGNQDGFDVSWGAKQFARIVKKGNVGLAESCINAVLEKSKFNLSSDLLITHLGVLNATTSEKSVAQKFKQVLSLPSNRNNLSLWRAFAKFTRHSKGLPAARKIYSAALKANFEGSNWLKSCILWQGWAEMEWTAGSTVIALNLLVSSAKGEVVDTASENTPSSIDILLTKKALAREFDKAFLNSTSTTNRLAAGYCCALFAYLTGDEVAGVISLYSTYLERLELLSGDTKTEHQELFDSFLKLIWWDRERVLGSKKSGGIYNSSLLRSWATKAVEMFPKNTTFIGIYVANEAREKLNHRVNTLFDNYLLPVKNSASNYFLLFWIERHFFRSSNPDRARHALLRALGDLQSTEDRDSESCLSSLIWMTFIQFELELGNAQKAKSLVLRAMNSCRMTKKFYLLPFRELKEMYTFEEFSRFYTTLVARGIRLTSRMAKKTFDELERTSIEKLENALQEANESSIQDVEELYDERERLKPY